LLPEFDVDRVRAAAAAACLRRLRELIPAEVRTYCTVATAVREGAAYRHAAQSTTIWNGEVAYRLSRHARVAGGVLNHG